MRYGIFDVETASFEGPTEGSSGVAEVACLMFDKDLTLEEIWSSLVNPGRPMSEGATVVNGITDDMVRDAPTLRQVFELNMSRAHEPICFIAHNVNFDIKFLASEIQNMHYTLCTLALARQYIRRVTNYKLGTLVEELSLQSGIAHRALGDVYSTFSLFKQILKVSGRSIDDLCKLSVKPRVLPVVPFGKHKNKQWFDVPVGYLQWMLENDFPADIMHTARQALKAKGIEA
jgi:DNA polymerase III alpha subunit (gram-positive type)